MHLISSSNLKSKEIVCNLINETSYPSIPEEIDAGGFDINKEKQLKWFKTINERHSDIKCFDFSVATNTVVYGCSNGVIKVV